MNIYDRIRNSPFFPTLMNFENLGQGTVKLELEKVLPLNSIEEMSKIKINDPSIFMSKFLLDAFGAQDLCTETFQLFTLAIILKRTFGKFLVFPIPDPLKRPLNVLVDILVILIS